MTPCVYNNHVHRFFNVNFHIKRRVVFYKENFVYPIFNWLLNTRVFLNYHQHKLDFSANYFFPFISFIEFIIVTHNFDGKCYLIF